MYLGFRVLHTGWGMRAVRSIISLFLTLTLSTSYIQAQPISLPAPGTLVNPSGVMAPVQLQGIHIHPEDPLKMDFVISQGDVLGDETHIKEETTQLAKYFLAALTTPAEALWVNLSPYESDRVIQDQFGETEMGRDMLAQDYLLKQLTASLTHPEGDVGQRYWEKLYARAYATLGTTDIPVDTFHKVWIVPGSAEVYEHAKGALVTNATLKVMVEKDYVAEQHNRDTRYVVGGTQDKITEDVIPADTSFLRRQESRSGESNVTINRSPINTFGDDTTSISSQIMREVIIPVIEEEINTGEHFAPLRQMYHAIVLAEWYKFALKDALLARASADQYKNAGVSHKDTQANTAIYNQYLTALEQGVYDLIKEETNLSSNTTTPRHYFGGGFSLGIKNLAILVGSMLTLAQSPAVDRIEASLAQPTHTVPVDFEALTTDSTSTSDDNTQDFAMDVQNEEVNEREISDEDKIMALLQTRHVNPAISVTLDAQGGETYGAMLKQQYEWFPNVDVPDLRAWSVGADSSRFLTTTDVNVKWHIDVNQSNQTISDLLENITRLEEGISQNAYSDVLPVNVVDTWALLIAMYHERLTKDQLLSAFNEVYREFSKDFHKYALAIDHEQLDRYEDIDWFVMPNDTFRKTTLTLPRLIAQTEEELFDHRPIDSDEVDKLIKKFGTLLALKNIIRQFAFHASSDAELLDLAMTTDRMAEIKEAVEAVMQSVPGYSRVNVVDKDNVYIVTITQTLGVPGLIRQQLDDKRAGIARTLGINATDIQLNKESSAQKNITNKSDYVLTIAKSAFNGERAGDDAMIAKSAADRIVALQRILNSSLLRAWFERKSIRNKNELMEYIQDLSSFSSNNEIAAEKAALETFSSLLQNGQKFKLEDIHLFAEEEIRRTFKLGVAYDQDPAVFKKGLTQVLDTQERIENRLHTAIKAQTTAASIKMDRNTRVHANGQVYVQYEDDDLLEIEANDLSTKHRISKVELNHTGYLYAFELSKSNPNYYWYAVEQNGEHIVTFLDFRQSGQGAVIASGYFKINERLEWADIIQINEDWFVVGRAGNAYYVFYTNNTSEPKSERFSQFNSPHKNRLRERILELQGRDIRDVQSFEQVLHPTEGMPSDANDFWAVRINNQTRYVVVVPDQKDERKKTLYLAPDQSGADFKKLFEYTSSYRPFLSPDGSKAVVLGERKRSFDIFTFGDGLSAAWKRGIDVQSEMSDIQWNPQSTIIKVLNEFGKILFFDARSGDQIQNPNHKFRYDIRTTWDQEGNLLASADDVNIFYPFSHRSLEALQQIRTGAHVVAETRLSPDQLQETREVFEVLRIKHAPYDNSYVLTLKHLTTDDVYQVKISSDGRVVLTFPFEVSKEESPEVMFKNPVLFQSTSVDPVVAEQEQFIKSLESAGDDRAMEAGAGGQLLTPLSPEDIRRDIQEHVVNLPENELVVVVIDTDSFTEKTADIVINAMQSRKNIVLLRGMGVGPTLDEYLATDPYPKALRIPGAILIKVFGKYGLTMPASGVLADVGTAYFIRKHEVGPNGAADQQNVEVYAKDIIEDIRTELVRNDHVQQQMGDVARIMAEAGQHGKVTFEGVDPLTGNQVKVESWKNEHPPDGIIIDAQKNRQSLTYRRASPVTSAAVSHPDIGPEATQRWRQLLQLASTVVLYGKHTKIGGLLDEDFMGTKTRIYFSDMGVTPGVLSDKNTWTDQSMSVKAARVDDVQQRQGGVDMSKALQTTVVTREGSGLQVPAMALDVDTAMITGFRANVGTALPLPLGRLPLMIGWRSLDPATRREQLAANS